MEINKIYNEDCLISLSKFSDKSIDGIVTSPPYNIAIERSDCYYDNGYSEIDNLSEEQYISLRTSEFKEFSRVLKDRGIKRN